MPEYSMYISCAPNPDESVRENAIDQLRGTVLIDDPVAPTYHTTTAATTREAAAAWATATLRTAGMQVTNIEFIPADIGTPGAGNQSFASPAKPPNAAAKHNRSPLARVAHWATHHNRYTSVLDRLRAPHPQIAASH